MLYKLPRTPVAVHTGHLVQCSRQGISLSFGSGTHLLGEREGSATEESLSEGTLNLSGVIHSGVWGRTARTVRGDCETEREKNGLPGKLVARLPNKNPLQLRLRLWVLEPGRLRWFEWRIGARFNVYCTWTGNVWHVNMDIVQECPEYDFFSSQVFEVFEVTINSLGFYFSFFLPDWINRVISQYYVVKCTRSKFTFHVKWV